MCVCSTHTRCENRFKTDELISDWAPEHFCARDANTFNRERDTICFCSEHVTSGRDADLVDGSGHAHECVDVSHGVVGVRGSAELAR